MATYLQQYDITIEDEKFDQNWDNLQNFEISFNRVRVGILRYDIEDGFCNIRDLHLEPQYQSQGIGSTVIRQLISKMQAKGLTAIRLKAFIDNPAIDLYKRLGFERIGQEDYIIQMKLDL